MDILTVGVICDFDHVFSSSLSHQKFLLRTKFKSDCGFLPLPNSNNAWSHYTSATQSKQVTVHYVSCHIPKKLVRREFAIDTDKTETPKRVNYNYKLNNLY